MISAEFCSAVSRLIQQEFAGDDENGKVAAAQAALERAHGFPSSEMQGIMFEVITSFGVQAAKHPQFLREFGFLVDFETDRSQAITNAAKEALEGGCGTKRVCTEEPSCAPEAKRQKREQQVKDMRTWLSEMLDPSKKPFFLAMVRAFELYLQDKNFDLFMGSIKTILGENLGVIQALWRNEIFSSYSASTVAYAKSQEDAVNSYIERRAKEIIHSLNFPFSDSWGRFLEHLLSKSSHVQACVQWLREFLEDGDLEKTVSRYKELMEAVGFKQFLLAYKQCHKGGNYGPVEEQIREFLNGVIDETTVSLMLRPVRPVGEAGQAGPASNLSDEKDSLIADMSGSLIRTLYTKPLISLLDLWKEPPPAAAEGVGKTTVPLS